MSEIIYKSFRSVINRSWIELFEVIDKDIWKITEEEYNLILSKNKNIFPIYSNIFNFTNFLIPEDIKVCIIGQDPYHNVFKDKETNYYYPEANGLSFSVPKKCHIPSSLQNIYKNLLKFKHILWQPSHGDLSYWSYQGVLLLNSSLTVEKGKPNSCQSLWYEFTNEIIKIISSKYSGIVFLLWGKHAYMKKFDDIIKNQQNHSFIISSHPSGYSANSSFREYESFMDTDHFGIANNYLIKQNKIPIDWNIL